VRGIDRARLDRWRRNLSALGLAFALGILVDTLLVHRLSLRHETALPGNAWGDVLSPDGTRPDGTRSDDASIGPSTGTDPSPAHATTDAPVQRPGEGRNGRGSDRDAAPVATSGALQPGTIAAGAVATGHATEELRDRDLLLPVDGVKRSDLRDTFADARGSDRPHEAMDIMAPRHTPVRAVEDGRIEKLFTSKAGGLTIYQFEDSGTFSYYYAHLDRYADGLVEGQRVEKGEILGYVGSSGNASPDAPHLHFAIFRLTPERRWWQGEPLNPYPVLK